MKLKELCVRCKDRLSFSKKMCQRCYYATKFNRETKLEKKIRLNFSKNGVFYLGGKFIVDRDIFEKYKDYIWSDSHDGYAKNTILGYLHRNICPEYNRVDHINRNTFDNRRENLREGLYINVLNTEKRKKPCPIYKNKQGLWYGRTQIEGKRFYIRATINRDSILNKLREILTNSGRIGFYNLN